mmetsp:Transcript_2199/g.4847  ORF Transcript_2199/g.4847 Transcript_2199/m.4847 type:complete len:426 (+) Transcript_2199:250-1527(+)
MPEARTAADRIRERSAQLRKGLPGGAREIKSIRSDVDQAAEELQADVDTLRGDLDRRGVSYERREMDYVNRIKTLGAEIERVREGRGQEGGTDPADKFDELKAFHAEIMGNLDLVDTRTTKILQDQERDLLRAFRARLFDVQTELDREKSKKDDSAAAWIQRSRQLEAEVDWAKEMADRLKRVNTELGKENNELKKKFKSGEEDRNYLIKQLVAVKKDNSRLQQELERVDSELSDLNEKKNNPRIYARAPASTFELPAVDKYEDKKNAKMDEIKRLKRLLEGQQRQLRTTRQEYAAALYSRTELQRFLKQCLLDIRQEIDKLTKPQYAQAPPSFSAFSSAAAKPLELLQSQDRVVSMLYHKAFPIMPKGGQQLNLGSSMGSTDDYTSMGVSQEEFAGVYAEKSGDRPTTADWEARKGGLFSGAES